MRDSDVRAAVRRMLNDRYAGDKDTRIVEEMGIWSGSVRIDVAVINGEFCGYELKSDRDTLLRLPAQADLYSRVFDRVTLVAGRHSEKGAALIPSWWGLIHAIPEGEGVRLVTSREGSVNPEPDPYLVAQLLWKEEALEVLESRGLARGWRGRRVKLIHQRLASELPFAELAAEVRRAMKRRDAWLGQMVPSNLDMAVHADTDPVF